MKQSRKGNAPTRSARSGKRVRSLSQFALKLLREWRRLRLPETGSVIVAVSGGGDSVALLLALDELIKAKHLKLDILPAHLNHKLRGTSSDHDARWVRSLAKNLGYRAIVKAADVSKRARLTEDNLEQSARRARYEFLAKAAKANKTKAVLTAHTLDDQAETILLNLLRGSGAEGLSGMDTVRPIYSESEIVLARPLLSWARRGDTESFCRQRSIDFCI